MNQNKKILVLTAGHGGGNSKPKDPGAVNGNVTESEIVTDARNIIVFYLNQWQARDGVNFEIVTDGKGIENLPLKEAIKLHQKNADVKIELHCNSSALPTACGVEALAHNAHNNVQLCQDLCAAVSDVLKIKMRGNKGYKTPDSGQHRRLAVCDAGGVILELFFISNNNELKKWQLKKWLACKAIATVLYNKLTNYKFYNS